MSFVMIAAGSTRGSSTKTLSLRSLLLGSALAGLTLLVAGTALGYWLCTQTAFPDVAELGAAAPHARAATPFAVEQLGALSGRLFKLESMAGQLSERLGSAPSAAVAKAAARAGSAAAAHAGSGGPLMPPRLEQEAADDLGVLQARVLAIEAQLATVSDAAALQHLAQMRMPSHLPVRVVDVVSVFGNREDPLTGHRAFHSGLDFAAPMGTPIMAAAGGRVVFAGFKPDYGWSVDIEHGNGLTTRYGHASRLRVQVGDLVEPGDTIADVGSTGRSTGPHLHFEVLRLGAATDPKAYLAGL
jgi:murein DD-endopeptidase MepM/ murein hydrolase activator NlpD